MLMRKFHELMSAQGLTKKNEDSDNVSDDGGENRDSRAVVVSTTSNGQ